MKEKIKERERGGGREIEKKTITTTPFIDQ